VTATTRPGNPTDIDLPEPVRVGHYPAIGVLHSLSRLTSQIAAPRQPEAARKLRQALATYRDAEDLIQLGAYAAGSNPALAEWRSAVDKELEGLSAEAYLVWWNHARSL
jgi:flagellar biosynthesis/type III secretory pathway ATPase